jgi:hypothetical protein
MWSKNAAVQVDGSVARSEANPDARCRTSIYGSNKKTKMEGGSEPIISNLNQKEKGGLSSGLK